MSQQALPQAPLKRISIPGTMQPDPAYISYMRGREGEDLEQ